MTQQSKPRGRVLRAVLLPLFLLILARAGATVCGAEPESDIATSDLRSALRFRQLELDGPEQAEPGRLVVLDSSAIPATARAWHLLNPPADDNHQLVDNGERFLFATRHPGRYWIVFAFSTEESPGVVIVPRLLVIGDGGDGGDDDRPAPPKPPKPPEIPDGRFKLGRLAWDQAQKLPTSVRKQAGEVAAIHQAVASRIAAGGLKDIDAALEHLATRLASGLGDGFDPWKPWGRAVMGRVTELYKSGELKSLGDLADALEEMATGLELVK